jgi:hypothetical protein
MIERFYVRKAYAKLIIQVFGIFPWWALCLKVVLRMPAEGETYWDRYIYPFSKPF